MKSGIAFLTGDPAGGQTRTRQRMRPGGICAVKEGGTWDEKHIGTDVMASSGRSGLQGRPLSRAFDEENLR